MSYPQTTGANCPYPGYNPYNPYPIQPTYPFTPTYTPVRQPNVSPTTYDAPQVGTSAPVRGRIVKVDTDISPSDVPMDGFSSYFPAEDGSCIYVKHWDKDGKIQTTKFVPASNDTSDFVPTASFEDEMRERMDTLENLLRQRNNYKPKYQKQNGSEHKDGGNDVRS